MLGICYDEVSVKGGGHIPENMTEIIFIEREIVARAATVIGEILVALAAATQGGDGDLVFHHIVDGGLHGHFHVALGTVVGVYRYVPDAATGQSFAAHGDAMVICSHGRAKCAVLNHHVIGILGAVLLAVELGQKPQELGLGGLKAEGEVDEIHEVGIGDIGSPSAKDVLFHIHFLEIKGHSGMR